MKFLMVGIGGGLGSMLRYWVSVSINERMGTQFPYGTVVVNITGSFLIGLIVTLLAGKGNWNPNLWYLIPIGFIGGYTTFSTFEYETLRSMLDGRMFSATLNVVVSVVAGFFAVWLGVLAGRAIE